MFIFVVAKVDRFVSQIVVKTSACSQRQTTAEKDGEQVCVCPACVHTASEYKGAQIESVHAGLDFGDNNAMVKTAAAAAAAAARTPLALNLLDLYSVHST